LANLKKSINHENKNKIAFPEPYKAHSCGMEKQAMKAADHRYRRTVLSLD